jgi:hypothetical protein
MALLIAVSKKLASSKGGEEGEFCSLMSKFFISKVILSIVMVSKSHSSSSLAYYTNLL